MAYQTRFLGDVGKGAIAVILIEPVGRPLHRPFVACPRQQEDVEPAVVVIVEEGDTATHRLQDVIHAIWGTEDHRCAQASARGDIGEVRVKWKPRRFSARLWPNPTGGHAPQLLCPGDTGSCGSCGEDGKEFAAIHIAVIL